MEIENDNGCSWIKDLDIRENFKTISLVSSISTSDDEKGACAHTGSMA